VAAIQILEDFVHQVALGDRAARAKVPQVVVRIADRELGVQNFLGDQAQPFVIRRHNYASVVLDVLARISGLMVHTAVTVDMPVRDLVRLGFAHPDHLNRVA